MKSIIIDVETTSLNADKGAIIELAALVLHDKKEVGRFEVRIEPFDGAEISYDIGKDLRRIPQREAYIHFIQFLDKFINKFDKEDKFHFIAYNAEFDTKFVRKFFERNGNAFYGSYFFSPSICMMQAAAMSFMKKHTRSNINSMKLKDVASANQITVKNEKLHNAMYDVEITYELFKKLVKFAK